MGVKVWRLSMLSLHSFELRLSKSETVVPPMDVADYEAMYRGASIVEERLGPIDIWISDAMTSVFAPMQAITPQEFRRLTEKHTSDMYTALSRHSSI